MLNPFKNFKKKNDEPKAIRVIRAAGENFLIVCMPAEITNDEILEMVNHVVVSADGWKTVTERTTCPGEDDRVHVVIEG